MRTGAAVASAPRRTAGAARLPAATAAVEHASQALFGRGELDRLDEATLAAALRELGYVE